MTRWLVRAAAGVGFLMALSAASAGPAQDEQKRLQGAWEITEYTFLGKADPGPNRTVWTFTGDKITVSNTKDTWKYKIDPSKKPKHIDVAVDPKKPKEVFKSVYELKGDTLKVCMPVSFKDKRPARVGGNEQVFTLKRKKPDA